jgi:hypothetical protein
VVVLRGGRRLSGQDPSVIRAQRSCQQKAPIARMRRLATGPIQFPDVVARWSRRLAKITRPRSRISVMTRCSWSSKYGP